MASETKNYNSCPLKKRPILYVPPVVKDEPEQEEPVNLCIRKVNTDEAAHMNKMARPMPLKDITAHNQQERIRYPPYKVETRVPYEKQELYNLLPGYNYIQQTTPPPSASSIKSEPEYWPSYSREASLSPPSTRITYAPPSPPIKVPAIQSINNGRETFYQSENSLKFQYVNKSNRYAPYVNRQQHLLREYHSSMSPTHSHSSLHSLGGSSRSSMSPASTSSSIDQDQYHMMQASNTSNSTTTFTKPMTYETATEHSVIMKSDMPRYQCSDCSKSYSTCSGLTKHKQFHCTASPNNQAPKSHNCQFCEKTYNTMGALKMHIRTHTKPCKCHICGKAFSRPWLLQGHIRTHTGDKPFKCNHCDRAFADKSNLRAHLQTHSDVKKYSCSTCSKTFSRMSLLIKHTESGCPGLLEQHH